MERCKLWLKGVFHTDKLDHDKHTFKLLYRARPLQNEVVAIQYHKILRTMLVGSYTAVCYSGDTGYCFHIRFNIIGIDDLQ